jgi:hypothetical protein
LDFSSYIKSVGARIRCGVVKNTTSATHSSSIDIAGETFTVNQLANGECVCSNTPSKNIKATGGIGTITAASNYSCI